jgi:hypothetical protein
MVIAGVLTNTPTDPSLFGGATPEQVAAAVADYIAKNPVNRKKGVHSTPFLIYSHQKTCLQASLVNRHIGCLPTRFMIVRV